MFFDAVEVYSRQYIGGGLAVDEGVALYAVGADMLVSRLLLLFFFNRVAFQVF